MTDKQVSPRDPEVAEFFEWEWNQAWDMMYRDGWFNGGENLACDLIQSESLAKLDPEREFHGLFLPMLYCYRHWLEVALKHLIKALQRRSSLELSFDLQNEHGLMPLWNEAKRHMKNTIFDSVDDADKNVERLINTFHQFDSSSQTFRYRCDTSGRPQEDGLPIGDPDNLVRTMRGLRNYFSGCEDAAWYLEQDLE